MSIIPLHIQRRFEQRWAARFSSLVIPGRTKERRIERLTVNIAPRAAKAKEKPAGVPPGSLVSRGQVRADL